MFPKSWEQAAYTTKEQGLNCLSGHESPDSSSSADTGLQCASTQEPWTLVTKDPSGDHIPTAPPGSDPGDR